MRDQYNENGDKEQEESSITINCYLHMSQVPCCGVYKGKVEEKPTV